MNWDTLVVGLGGIGVGYDADAYSAETILSHAKALELHPAFTLCAGVDPDGDSRARFEQRHGRPAYASIGEALDAHTPTVVVIANPTPRHAETLHALLERNTPAAILCEKPLDHDPATARSMVDACERHGVPLYVNYIRRADPGVAEIKHRLADGRIRPPFKGTGWYTKGIIHNGSHFVDLLSHWLGAPIETRILSPGRLWDGIDPEPDLQLTFHDGAVTLFAHRDEAYTYHAIEILADNGRLAYVDGGRRAFWQGIDPDTRTLEPDGEALPTDLGRYQWHVYEWLAHTLTGTHETPLCTGSEALATLKTITDAVERGTEWPDNA